MSTTEKFCRVSHKQTVKGLKLEDKSFKITNQRNKKKG